MRRCGDEWLGGGKNDIFGSVFLRITKNILNFVV